MSGAGPGRGRRAGRASPIATSFGAFAGTIALVRATHALRFSDWLMAGAPGVAVAGTLALAMRSPAAPGPVGWTAYGLLGVCGGVAYLPTARAMGASGQNIAFTLVMAAGFPLWVMAAAVVGGVVATPVVASLFWAAVLAHTTGGRPATAAMFTLGFAANAAGALYAAWAPGALGTMEPAVVAIVAWHLGHPAALYAATALGVRERRDLELACPSCGYDLQGLTGPVCPECGGPAPGFGGSGS